MFQITVGSVLLLFTAGLIIKYRPKSFTAWYLCFICALMAIMSMVTGGGTWGLQLVQTLSQLVLATCTLFYLHREKLFAARKQQAFASNRKNITAEMETNRRKVKPTKGCQSVERRKTIMPQQPVSMKYCA